MPVNFVLRDAIARQGKRQREFAAALQPPIPETRFSNIVNGWTEPRAHEREVIAAALGRCVEELFGPPATPHESQHHGSAAAV